MINKLSNQQQAIMYHVITGAYNREIAEELGISKHAVDTQLGRIREKYNARDKVAAMLVHLGNLAQQRK
jgi:DNA-binding CsgD family transcriptional regulator